MNAIYFLLIIAIFGGVLHSLAWIIGNIRYIILIAKGKKLYRQGRFEKGNNTFYEAALLCIDISGGLKYISTHKLKKIIYEVTQFSPNDINFSALLASIDVYEETCSTEVAEKVEEEIRYAFMVNEKTTPI